MNAISKYCIGSTKRCALGVILLISDTSISHKLPPVKFSRFHSLIFKTDIHDHMYFSASASDWPTAAIRSSALFLCFISVYAKALHICDLGMIRRV